MRILLVSHGYPPFGFAGVERVTEQSAIGLTSAGHEVTVLSRRITPAPGLPRVEHSRHKDGVEVIMVAGGATSPGGPFPGHQDRLERIFERVLLQILPDVVVIGHLVGHSPGYVSVAHRWRVPVVLELHDFYTVCERAHLERLSGDLCDGPDAGRACAQHCFSDQEDGVGRWALRTHLFGLAVAEADAVICPSQFVADHFCKLNSRPKELHVIPNGISLEGRTSVIRETPGARSGEAPLRLASIGVVTPHKGAHVVVESLRKARLPAVRYTLFGALTQPYAARLRRTAERNSGLELQTYGAFEPSSLPDLLAQVDAVVVPSLVWETFSIVAREAMACGVPVIASRLGALPEAVRDGENGLLFAVDKTSELAEIFQRINADRSILDGLRAGIRPSDWITVEERTERLETLLERICLKGATEENLADFPALRRLVSRKPMGGSRYISLS